MIIKTELVKRIKDYFNLNIYETKVWLALLSKGIASAREIADLSGVPRSRTYDVLESLEKRGFAITKIGKPVKYISVKPTEVIEKMKSYTLQEAQEKVSSLSNLRDLPEYEELEKMHNTGISPINSSEITGSLKGRGNVTSRLKDVLDNSKKEVLICTSLNDFEDKSRVLIPAIEKLNKDNVKIKIALSGDPDKIKKISSKHGIKIKPTDSDARFYLSDKSEALFMITPDSSKDELGVWMKSEFFARSLSSIIENALRN